MKKHYVQVARMAIVSVFIGILFVGCEEPEPTDLNQALLLPQPVSITASGASFILNSKGRIHVIEADAEWQKNGEYLASLIKKTTGETLAIVSADDRIKKGSFVLKKYEGLSDLGTEGYEISIDPKSITLSANAPSGIFYAIQTLRQLLPVEGEQRSDGDDEVELATGSIRDYPRYTYRGAMLDVARHFFGVDDVKRFIDLMAVYKMNILHLHLSDDQGWRIEIKSWPNLTQHGGSTQVGGGAGGYFTQEQFSEIVAYATSRYITIIPEIDMPGHTNAALASYPELNCNGVAPKLYTGTNVGFSTLCTKKEITYQFIDDVVREISAISPGPWFHIGGDESHVTRVQDYIPFINRVQEIVNLHGKEVMGWDDIAISTLKPNSVAQYWARSQNAQNAVRQGAGLVLSPGSLAYLDMKYDENCKLGLNWAGYIEVDKAYAWDPDTLVKGVSGEQILGIEAPLWSETVTHMEDIEFMVFPRLPGYAEIGWSRQESRSWDSYKIRLAGQQKQFESMGINFYQTPKVEWTHHE